MFVILLKLTIKGKFYYFIEYIALKILYLNFFNTLSGPKEGPATDFALFYNNILFARLHRYLNGNHLEFPIWPPRWGHTCWFRGQICS